MTIENKAKYDNLKYRIINAGLCGEKLLRECSILKIDDYEKDYNIAIKNIEKHFSKIEIWNINDQAQTQRNKILRELLIINRIFKKMAKKIGDWWGCVGNDISNVIKNLCYFAQNKIFIIYRLINSQK